MLSLQGRHWSLTGPAKSPTLDLFGLKGRRIGSQTYLGERPDRLVAVHFDTIYIGINRNIDYMQQKHVKALAHVAVNEFVGLRLFFEHILKADDLRAAEEDMMSISVKLLLGSAFRTVLILEHPAKEVMYFDQNGEEIFP